LLAGLLLTGAARAAVPPAEQLLPADTLGLVAFPDCAAFQVASQNSPQMMCWNSAEMKPFREKLMGQLQQLLAGSMEKELGLKWDDFSGLMQGQFTMAVTLNGWDGGDDETRPGMLVLLDAKQKSDDLKALLAKFRQKWLDDRKPLREETVHGVTFTVLTLTSNAVPSALTNVVPQPHTIQEMGKPERTTKAVEIVYAQYESLLIVGSSLKAVEPVATRLTGGGVTPLAENPLFAADQASQFRDHPLYYLWFNGKGLFDTLAAHAPEPPNPDAPSPFPQFDLRAILKATGMMGMHTMAVAVRETPAGSSATFHVTAPAEQRAGLLKMFSLVPKESAPPAFVPAGVVKIVRARMDGRQVWAELLKMVGGISPQLVGQMNGSIDLANSIGQMKTPGFDIRTSLIANLGDDWISYEKPPVDTSLAALTQPPSIFLMGVSNPDQVVNAVKTITMVLGGAPADGEPRDFLGHKIYTLNLRGTADPSTGEAGKRPLYMAASGGYLALTADTGMMEEYLRNGSGAPKPLSAIAGMDEALQAVGGTGGGMFTYSDDRQAIRIAIDMFKSLAGLQGKATSSSPTSPSGLEWLNWFDVSLLPDYATVQKYFSFSVLSGGMDSQGFTLKMFAPRPPGI